MELNRACAHIMTTGDTCGSYALRDSDLCYWHHKARETREERTGFNRRQKAKPTGLVLPLLEDANSIQLAVQMIAQAIADRRLSRAEAGTLLYSIQLAIINLKNVQRPRTIYSERMLVLPDKSDEVEDIGDASEIPVNRDPDFNYGIPEVDDEEEEEEEEEEEIDPERSASELAAAETFINKNLPKLQRLGVMDKDGHTPTLPDRVVG